MLIPPYPGRDGLTCSSLLFLNLLLWHAGIFSLQSYKTCEAILPGLDYNSLKGENKLSKPLKKEESSLIIEFYFACQMLKEFAFFLFVLLT